MEVKERWIDCKGSRGMMCSDQGNFLFRDEASGIWSQPDDSDLPDASVNTIAAAWLGATKKHTVQFINGDSRDWRVSNLRVVDVPKKLTIRMKFDKDQITKEMVEQVLQYNPSTGHFLTKSAKGGAPVWKFAGEIGTYYMVNLFGGSYRAQEIAVLIMTGTWPVGEVNVKNSNWGDARWENVVV